MFGDVLRSRKVRIGLALLLVGLSAFLLKPGKQEQASLLPQIPAAKTLESVSPPRLSVQAQHEADGLSSQIDRKIDSIIRLIGEIIE